PPSAADIQQAVSRGKAQFSADVVEFLFLSLVQPIFWRSEVSGGILHPGIKKQGVKVRGEIIVITDGLKISRRRMNRPCHTQMAGDRLRSSRCRKPAKDGRQV